MNKLTKISLAVLGGVETIFSILSPVLIVLMWLVVMDSTNKFGQSLLVMAGIIATVFRAIKVGWLKE
jgi:hypothetical protein